MARVKKNARPDPKLIKSLKNIESGYQLEKEQIKNVAQIDPQVEEQKDIELNFEHLTVPGQD